MMVRLWPNLAAAPMRTGGSYRGKTGHASLWWARRFMTQSGPRCDSYCSLAEWA